MKKMLPYFAKTNVRGFCDAKAYQICFSNNVNAIDFASTLRINESPTYEFVKLTIL